MLKHWNKLEITLFNTGKIMECNMKGAKAPIEMKAFWNP
jgi:hypothetical protein